MEFFFRSPDDVLLVDARDRSPVTAAAVRDESERYAQYRGGLAFLFADQSLEAATRFLALLEAGVPVVLLDSRMDPGAALELHRRYRPELVLAPATDSPVLTSLPPEGAEPGGIWRAAKAGPATHPQLCVLLSTSGSTGSPKLVRLSRDNIVSNARAIAASLDLVPSDRSVTSLPLFYSFGMSLITSHLVAGSSVLVTARSVLDREFFAELDTHRVTHLAGVPQTYAMLKRLRFNQRPLPHLKALLQAGGRLAPDLVAEFDTEAKQRGRRLFVMYGQTEASPRMACLPPDRLPEKLGAAGRALAGGAFTVVDPGGEALPAGQVGEIVYSGPNVMMGYSESRDDLSRGDDVGGVLHTGDLGYLDAEGFLFITGRTKRIAKVAGVRVSLDEVEAMLGSVAPAAAVAAGDDGVAVFTTVTDPDLLTKARRRLARQLGAPYSLVEVHTVAALPLLPTGKVDYSRLVQMRQESGRRGE